MFQRVETVAARVLFHKKKKSYTHYSIRIKSCCLTTTARYLLNFLWSFMQRQNSFIEKKLSISHCSVAVHWEQKRNFSEQAQAKFNFQGFQTKSETLKNDFLYLLVLCISPRHVWNKNYFPYPYVDHFHLRNIWFFSFPYS